MARGLFRGFERPPLWATIVIVVGGLGLIVALIVGPPARRDPVSAAQIARMDAHASAAASTTPAPDRPQIAQAMAKLADPSRPFTVAIISDSTGAAQASWVPQLASWMGQTYDRPVTMHSWAVETTPNGYGQPWPLVKQGHNAPITVWNGSAGGKDVAYSKQHLGEMIPIPADQVDLLIFSHGHNEGAGKLADDAASFLIPATTTYRNAVIVVVLQNPERPDIGQHAIAHDQNVAELGAWAKAQGFPIIDEHTAFEQMPGWQKEYADPSGFHPSVRGYQNWGQTVIQAFQSAAAATSTAAASPSA